MYPAMLNISGKDVLVVGGGETAYIKAMGLLNYHANVYVIAPKICQNLMEKSAEITIIKEEYQEIYTENKFIVVAVTDNEELNEQIGEHCYKANILCSILNKPHLSNFTVPAYLKRGDMIVTVASINSISDIVTTQDIEKMYPVIVEEKTEIVGRLRKLIAFTHTNEAEKKSLLRWISTLDISELHDYEKRNFMC